MWALGEGARVLADAAPEEAAAAEAAVRRVEPHLDRLLARYPETARLAPPSGGEARVFPLWLVSETAPDATSELLLGLVALEEAAPTDAGARRVRLFADGIALARFGSLDTFPYGGHASWVGGWHGWGNSQTQALAEAARLGLADGAALASAEAEAQSLYARLLVEGWLHNLDYATEEATEFEQIAYDVRPAAVGLVRLYEATGDERYAVLAGLAASWFHGLNPADATMADPGTGRGYDGVLAPDRVNWNAGAESHRRGADDAPRGRPPPRGGGLGVGRGRSAPVARLARPGRPRPHLYRPRDGRRRPRPGGRRLPPLCRGRGRAVFGLGPPLSP